MPITSGKVKQPYLNGPFSFIDVTLRQDCATGLNWQTIHLTGECNLEGRALIEPAPHLTTPRGQEMVRHSPLSHGGHIVPGDQKSFVLPRQASQWKPWR